MPASSRPLALQALSDSFDLIADNRSERNSANVAVSLGILLKPASINILEGNSCIINDVHGITIQGSSAARLNVCSYNGILAEDGAGIIAYSAIATIEDNLVTYNDLGIRTDFPGNYVASNRARNNTTNYSFTSGTTVGSGDLANVSY